VICDTAILCYYDASKKEREKERNAEEYDRMTKRKTDNRKNKSKSK